MPQSWSARDDATAPCCSPRSQATARTPSLRAHPRRSWPTTGRARALGKLHRATPCPWAVPSALRSPSGSTEWIRPGRPRRPARRGRGEPAEAPRGDPGHQPDGRRDLPPRLPAAQLAARRRRRHLRLRAHATRRPGPRLRPARIPTLARPHTCAPPSSTATDAPSTTPNAASWSAFGAIEAATAWSRATRRTATALSAHGQNRPVPALA